MPRPLRRATTDPEDERTTMQITTTPGDLWECVPEGDVPETITVRGVVFTAEQISKIHAVIRSNVPITVQQLSKGQLAVRTHLMPEGTWYVYQPDGEFSELPLGEALPTNTVRKELPTKVEVLHVRDPDSECYLAVFVNGEPVSFHEQDVDPGRGYERDDWDERVEGVQKDAGMTPAFKAATLDALRENADSKWNL